MVQAFLIGFVAGLRSLTAPAVIAWAARLHILQLENTPFSFLSSNAALAILTALACIELVADQRPSTPARTKPMGLIARFVTGGFSGACLAAALGQAIPVCGALGSAGGIVGAFAGYRLRTGIVKSLQVRDRPIALIEDVIAIAAGFVIVCWS